MRYVEFLARVEARAARGLSAARAATVTDAVLRALAQSLPPERRQQLASQLPKQLQRSLRSMPRNERPRKATKFLDVVAEREGLSRSEALDDSRAVLNVLQEAVTGHEMDHVRRSLPDDFRTLFKPPAVTKWPQTHARRARR